MASAESPESESALLGSGSPKEEGEEEEEEGEEEEEEEEEGAPLLAAGGDDGGRRHSRLRRLRRRRRSRTASLRVACPLDRMAALAFASSCEGGAPTDFVGNTLVMRESFDGGSSGGVVLRTRNDPLSWWAVDIGERRTPVRYTLRHSSGRIPDLPSATPSAADAAASSSASASAPAEECAREHASLLGPDPPPSAGAVALPAPRCWTLQATADSVAWMGMLSRQRAVDPADGAWVTLHTVTDDTELFERGGGTWDLDPALHAGRSFRYFRIVQTAHNHSRDPALWDVFAVWGFDLETEVFLGRNLLAARERVRRFLVSASSLEPPLRSATRFFAAAGGGGGDRRHARVAPSTSGDDDAPWVGVDFHTRVELRGYSFVATENPHPAQWVVQGNAQPGTLRIGSPQSAWFTIDRAAAAAAAAAGGRALAPGERVTRHLPEPAECSVLRFVQIESNDPPCNRLSVESIEVYGRFLDEQSSGACTAADRAAVASFLFGFFFGLLGFAAAAFCCRRRGAQSRVLLCSLLGCLINTVAVVFVIVGCFTPIGSKGCFENVDWRFLAPPIQ